MIVCLICLGGFGCTCCEEVRRDGVDCCKNEGWWLLSYVYVVEAFSPVPTGSEARQRGRHVV